MDPRPSLPDGFPWGRNTVAPGVLETESNPAEPTLDVHLVDGTGNTAVVIFPGGGYGGLSMDWEGNQPAAWLNKHHISAFVVRFGTRRAIGIRFRSRTRNGPCASCVRAPPNST